MSKRLLRVRAEILPGVASLEAWVPARREGGKEFQALGPDAQKDRSPKVFNLKVAHGKVGKSHDAQSTNG